jgi:hypothetical protein
MGRIGRASLAVVAACVAALTTSAFPALAGGTWLEFDADVVSPGTTLRGSATVHPGTQGTVDDGPFDVYLRPELDGDDPPRVDPAGERVGPVAQLRVGEPAGPFVDVEVEFVVPDVAPGGWYVDVCNADCATGLGDLVGGRITVIAPAVAAADTLPETGPHAALLGVGVGLLGVGALMLRTGVSRGGP